VGCCMQLAWWGDLVAQLPDCLPAYLCVPACLPRPLCACMHASATPATFALTGISGRGTEHLFPAISCLPISCLPSPSPQDAGRSCVDAGLLQLLQPAAQAHRLRSEAAGQQLDENTLRVVDLISRKLQRAAGERRRRASGGSRGKRWWQLACLAG
jgi:hypothetical protein